jgi:cell division protein FtsN
LKAARADSVARADSIAKAEAAAKKKAKALAKKEPAKKGPATKAAPTKAAAKQTPQAAASDTKGAKWSAQVAAYDTPADAEKLAKRLKNLGYETRVTGEKPFRVRIGLYSRRSEAVDLVAKLKDAKMAAIVVEAEKP